MRLRWFIQVALAVLLVGLLVACGLNKPTAQPTTAPQPAPGATAPATQSFEPWPETPPPMASLSKLWGPYLAEREWGNPREAVGGDGWGMTYELAKNTRYQAGEDGIAGWTDLEETVCFAFGFWDEQQRYVTERLFGFSNAQGKYGETVLEQRVFWENTPTHSYARYEYFYPFDKPNFDVEITYAKRDNQTAIVQVSVKATQAGVLHVLPTAWFRPPLRSGLRNDGSVQHLADDTFDLAYNGGHWLVKTATAPTSWQISTNATGRKDDFDQALVRDKKLANAGDGNRAAWDLALTLQAGETRTLHLALANAPDAEQARAHADAALAQFDSIISTRRQEADALYRNQVSEHKEVYRYALMNLLANKMYYQYNGSYEKNWEGKVDLHDVLLVPDKWEFPWPAMWDACFQANVATLADIEQAKHDLLVYLSPRWQTITGHVPNVEWGLTDETPPLFAWAAWEVYKADGDKAFLTEIFPRLELHYQYCRRALDMDNDHLYKGGFMGMDNVPRPSGADVEQADTSGWMALFAQRLSGIAQELGGTAKASQYQAEYATTVEKINAELWNEQDGFYYDRDRDGQLRIKSYSGLIPLIAGVPDAARVQRILAHLSNPDEFWSDQGVRSLSKDDKLYEPGYSTSGWKNSNWRGPVWIPINYLLVQTLSKQDPALAEKLRQNLVTTVEREWQARHHFYEYYQAETGEGLGADHQTGWTALVANLIRERWGR